MFDIQYVKIHKGNYEKEKTEETASGIYGITVFKIFIGGGILSDIRSEIWFCGDAQVEPLYVISDRISHNIPPQMKILNTVISNLLHFCNLVSNWSFASCMKPHVIMRNVT